MKTDREATYWQAWDAFHRMIEAVEDPAWILKGAPGFAIGAAKFARRYVKPHQDQELYNAIYNIAWHFFKGGE
jgi:hypothetical protein